MKAVFYRQPGPPEVLTYGDFQDPEPGPGEVVVKMLCCGVNHIDIWFRSGVYQAKLPHILGADVAGTVARVGDGVRDVQPGQPVTIFPLIHCGRCEFCLDGYPNLCDRLALLGAQLPGGYAEFVKVPAENIIPKPPNLGFEEVACLPINFGTAWNMLVSKAKVEAGEVVLVPGASGGVGYAAVQIAKMFGARVIATTSSEAKMEKARRLGTDEVVDHGREDLVARVKELTGGKGVDVVVDHLGAGFWEKAWKVVGKRGRIVTCGATTGTEGRLDIRHFYRNELVLYGVFSYSRGDVAAVIRHAAAGRLKPVIDRVIPLSQASEAHRVMEVRQHFGKILLRP